MTRFYSNSKKQIILNRRDKIEQWSELKAKGVEESTLQQVLHISRATFFRWKRVYDSQGLNALRPKSTRPHRVRVPEVLTKALLARIRALREQHPDYGKAKIHTELHKQGYTVSLSSVGRALHYLMQRGVITPVAVLKGKKERKLIRQFTNTHSKHLPKRYKTAIQLDHTIINLHGSEHRVFVAYDRASKFCLCKSYPHATSGNAADFLNFMISRWWYPPAELQVDGGSEFRGHFETACKNKNIRLFVLPPRSPKLNAGVERYNQTLQDEFFLPNYHTLPTDTDLLNAKLEEWTKYYNEQRPHRSLVDKDGFLMSPMQFLQSQMY